MDRYTALLLTIISAVFVLLVLGISVFEGINGFWQMQLGFLAVATVLCLMVKYFSNEAATNHF